MRGLLIALAIIIPVIVVVALVGATIHVGRIIAARRADNARAVLPPTIRDANRADRLLYLQASDAMRVLDRALGDPMWRQSEEFTEQASRLVGKWYQDKELLK